MALVSQRFTPLENQSLSLGELKTRGRERGDAEKKALYYLLKQTQDAALRHEKHVKLMEGDPGFLGFCEEKKVAPTVRQARKYLRRHTRVQKAA